MSANNVDPSTLFGGTWEIFAKGRTIIGKSDSGTFATLGGTGGAESRTISVSAHTHTISHTHTINSHSHTIAHTHSIANHNHTLSGTSLTEANLGSHSGHLNPWLASKGEFGEGKKAGYILLSGERSVTSQTAFDMYYGNEGVPRSQSRGSGSAHTHTVGNKALTTNGSSATNSGGSGTLTSNGASTANSESAGSQNISVNVTQPYIVVNIWKRTA